MTTTAERRLRTIEDAYVGGIISRADLEQLVEAALTDDTETMARSTLAVELVGYAVANRPRD